MRAIDLTIFRTGSVECGHNSVYTDTGAVYQFILLALEMLFYVHNFQLLGIFTVSTTTPTCRTYRKSYPRVKCAAELLLWKGSTDRLLLAG